MCYHCSHDEPPVHLTKEEHDAWLFPHGRYGYTDAAKIEAARAACPWCFPTPSLPVVFS